MFIKKIEKILIVINAFFSENSSKFIPVFILIGAIIVVSLNDSYASFKKVIHGDNVLFEVVSLDYKIESDKLVSNDHIILDAGREVALDLTVVDMNSIDSKYQVYYTSEDDLTKVEVGYSNRTVDGISGDIAAGTSKNITLVLVNNGLSQVKITFGVKGGLSKYSVDDILLENDEVRIVNEIKQIYQDKSGANAPSLVSELVPVIYDGKNWLKADLFEEWYDYDKQEWANAVVLKSGVSVEDGDVIDLETDIKGIFVWVPRYEYKILYNDANNIDVNFISIDKTVPSSDYILPDAFTFGTTNVDGVWLGKFETSIDESDEQLYVIPNAITVTEQSMNAQYNLGVRFNDEFLSSNIDVHMAKNSEWGVAAYLSASVYGKFGNENYTAENKEIYINNSMSLYTGRSGGSPNTSATSSGTYTYDKGFVEGTEESGIGASTTGNIYGIYDMNGGAYEYVMGYLTTASSTFGSTSSGYNAAGFTFTPDSKYYDAYTSGVSPSNIYYSHALGEVSGWYNDSVGTITGDLPWYMRGGVADGGESSGIFAYGVTSGYSGAYASFRLSLIITD